MNDYILAIEKLIVINYNQRERCDDMILNKYTSNMSITYGYKDVGNNFHIVDHNSSKGYAVIIERKKITGWYISELRKLNELSQKQIAYRLGITQSQYSKYENGRDQLSTEILIRFARVFNTTIEYISGNKREKEDLTAEREIYYQTLLMFQKGGYFPDEITIEQLQYRCV